MSTPLSAVALATVLATTPCSFAQKLNAELVVDGLIAPLDVCAAPGDPTRLFVLEQFSGTVRIVRNGVLEPTPFLNVSGNLQTGGNEQGILGIAFHPDFQSNGRVIVNYTEMSGDNAIEEYLVDASNPDALDPSSARRILTIFQPQKNHNGGGIKFGADGYLYIGVGDGGGHGDPYGAGQLGTTMLGKMLRIDVNGAHPYEVPASNPFVGDPNFLDEIWAYGLRNPWRFSFDSQTGDLWIGDVGQNAYEEIDFQPGNSPGGENYGWSLKEAIACYNPPWNCDPGGLTDPFWGYPQDQILRQVSVTGGFVYRGAAIPGMQGRYFYADYRSADVWSIREVSGRPVDHRIHPMTPANGKTVDRITTFGVDFNGELLMCDRLEGELWRIVHDSMSLSSTSLTAGAPATVTVAGATPGQTVHLGMSFVGPGAVHIPFLEVDFGLRQPQLVGTEVADVFGDAAFNGQIPSGSAWVGRSIWFQAAELGNTSEVVAAVVN
ncbi:MAG: PQQ-dependent sugar dehydrogenase [Planctomycetes bacterium]|nr:PQQ-dependent sugar dehydrogenase [Planctomycetota bacterium]